MKRMVKFIALTLVMAMFSLGFTGCSWLESQVHSLKGSLLGVSYTAEFYDNYGASFLTAKGKNIDITGNQIAELGFDAEGDAVTNYALSSVLTITIDGKEIQSCGNSIVFTENGLEKDVDFQLEDINNGGNSSLENLTSVAKVVNKYKNYFGKSRVVVIQSQLGIPICAYSGENWIGYTKLDKKDKDMLK